jgi:hypothetical protein
MERYEKYKDSGVEWIGEMPEGWEVRKLKYSVTVNPPKEDINKSLSELVVFLPMEKVGEDGKIDCSIRKPISELYNGFTFFRKNDVIIAKITPCFENGKGAILNALPTDFGFGSTEFHVLRVKTDIDSRYLYYITKSEQFMKIGEAFMSGAAGQKRVPANFISDYPLVSPILGIQSKIADYLDRKTAEIDKLIAQKERLIELYEEKKVTIINQAVTKGIDPDTKLKDTIYEPLFWISSYGFRPKLGCHDAIKALRGHLYSQSVRNVIDLDLSNYFGTIDHDLLMAQLSNKIQDKRFLRYIRRMFKAGVLSNGELTVSDEGVPQGSICSPILANIYAHYALDDWFNRTVKINCRGRVEIFRYADDAVICCGNAKDAERIRAALPKRLSKFKLKLNKDKTKTLVFNRFEKENSQSFDFLGFTFYLG